MKNIALCLSGYFSNKSGDDLLRSNCIYDDVINKVYPNNVDIFIFSFDIVNKDNINLKYPNAKISIIKEQKNMLQDLDHANLEYLKELSKYNPSSWSYNSASTLSFLYSRKQSIMLAINYSQQNNIIYDYIITSRFDVGNRAYKIVVDTSLDNKYIYSAYWNQLNAGFVDHWFFSNTENMLILADMYDYVLKYCFKLNSEYIQALSNWPDSDKQFPFNNIMLHPNISHINTSYDVVHSMNNHLLYKFYFYKTSLYKLSRML